MASDGRRLPAKEVTRTSEVDAPADAEHVRSEEAFVLGVPPPLPDTSERRSAQVIRDDSCQAALPASLGHRLAKLGDDSPGQHADRGDA
jgi:hypothetical protein